MGSTEGDEINTSTNVKFLSLSQPDSSLTEGSVQIVSLPFEKDVQYGVLSSLYCTLEPSAVLSLEKAIIYSNLRAFEESLAIFNSFPSK